MIPKEIGELIAVKAVQFLAKNPEDLGSFLAFAGVGPADIKESIKSPDFLGGVLDFLMQDESILMRFAQDMELQPQDVVKARLCFPGGEGELVC